MRLTLVFTLLALPATAQDLDLLPFPVIEVAGEDAEAEWHRLRDAPGTPVIIGDADAVTNLIDMFDPQWDEFYPLSPREVVAVANDLAFPDALYDIRAAEHADFVAWMKDNDYETDLPDTFDPVAIAELDMGRWPFFYIPPQEIISLNDWETGRPVNTAYIALLPTENPWEAPAYLRFGGWNANPSPEIHVAALRQWFNDYGAEPIVIAHDQMELWAPNRPTDQEAAIALAITHFHYDADVVLQGVGTISALAADRMRAPYWYFWWD